MKRTLVLALVLGTGLFTASAQAEMKHGQPHHMSQMGRGHMQAHGPNGIMGRHLLPKGKVMLAYRIGHMEMNGLRSGTTDFSPNTLVTTEPNRFFGIPGQPPTVRVAPLWMKGDMQMLGAMYGLSDKVTLMAMVPYLKKEMASVTFAGPAGTTVLGTSKMTSEGLGDVKIGALFGLHRKERTHVVAGLGISLPTGSITERGSMLSPTGVRMYRRMSYGMQLGSGTYDLMPSLSWQTGKGAWNWGIHGSGVVRLGSNDEGYSLGNQAALNLWASYKPVSWISYNARIESKTIGRIDGIDRNIIMPNAGADPLNYGGDSVSLYAGIDLSPKKGALKGHKFGLELGAPLYQSLNGPRLKRDWSVSFAWRKGF